MRKTLSLPGIVVLTFFILTAGFIACRKTDQGTGKQNPVAIPPAKNFFFVSPLTENLIHSIAQNIYRQNEEHAFTDDLIKRIGSPAWDHSMIVERPGSPGTVRHKENSPPANDQRVIVYIPFVKESERQTKAVLMVVIDKGDTTFNLLYPHQYIQFGFQKNLDTDWDAQTLFSLFAGFDHTLFGTQQYLVKDGRIFGRKKEEALIVTRKPPGENKKGIGAKIASITICAYWESCVYASESTGSGGSCTTVESCSTYWFEDGVGSTSATVIAPTVGGITGSSDWTNDPCSGSSVVRRAAAVEPVDNSSPCEGEPWVPMIYTRSPCDLANDLATNEFFISALKALKSVVNEKREYAGIYTQNAIAGNIENWQPVSGQENTAEISLSVSGKVDGLLHSHYTGLLSIFSPDDIYSMATLYVSERMKDQSMFTLGVVTASGTQYLLKIEDQTKFDKFAKNLVNNSTLDVYSHAYEYIYKISQGNTNDANEKSFLQYIQQSNSGLRLFKGNATFTTWESKKVDANNKVVNNPCN